MSDPNSRPDARERLIQAGIQIFAEYGFSATTTRMLAAYLAGRGVSPEDIMISYTPFGHTDWGRIFSDIKRFGSEGQKMATEVFEVSGFSSTLNVFASEADALGAA